MTDLAPTDDKYTLKVPEPVVAIVLVGVPCRLEVLSVKVTVQLPVNVFPSSPYRRAVIVKEKLADGVVVVDDRVIVYT